MPFAVFRGTLMALLLEKTVIYHPGRTGGHWVKAAVQQLGVFRAELGQTHDTPYDLGYLPEVQCRPSSITFVRHPLTWVRSLWIHETQFGWTNPDFRPQNEYLCFSDFLQELIERYPDGSASMYFAPFVDNVSLVGRFEALETDLLDLLRKAGEAVPESGISLPREINNSAPDIVSASAKAPVQLLERFLATEQEFCRRFNYAGIPQSCVADGRTVPVKWFPVLPATNGCNLGPEDIVPDQTFLFSDGLLWQGNPARRRSQLAIWHALSRTQPSAESRFLELGCGDGFFVFLAEQLGHAWCCGVDLYPRLTTKAAAARLNSAARFEYLRAFDRLTERDFTMILIREALNHTPWPHLLLLQAKDMLAGNGEILIECLIADPDSDPGLCFANGGNPSLLADSCPMIMSRAYLLNVIRQCGLEVAEVCSEYDEIVEKERKGFIEQRIARLIPASVDGFLRRVFWKLRALPGEHQPPELQLWLRKHVEHVVDYSAEDVNNAAHRTNVLLLRENQQLRSELQRLEGALHDTEVVLARERADLVDRTRRLEHALDELNILRSAAEQAHPLRSARRMIASMLKQLFVLVVLAVGTQQPLLFSDFVV